MDRIYHSGKAKSKKVDVGSPFGKGGVRGIFSNVGWVELGATHQKQPTTAQGLILPCCGPSLSLSVFCQRDSSAAR